MLNQAIERLKAHGIKPSAQRISIMEYLLIHRTHPTVETIYNALLPSMPTLSKTTVYNTLKLLEGNNVILELTIDKKTAHYDGDTMPHSHFLCKKCGKIADIPLTPMAAEQYAPDFFIDETEIYYKGYCNKCLDTDRNGQ